MKKPVDSLKVLAAAIALGVLVNTGCTPTFAKERDMAGSRAIAIRDCNVEANKFNPITQL
jgi:hypothetical protein